jgi:hypothetical protein
VYFEITAIDGALDAAANNKHGQIIEDDFFSIEICQNSSTRDGSNSNEHPSKYSEKRSRIAASKAL